MAKGSGLTKEQEKALEPLNKRQRAFLLYLLADETRNGTNAYTRAYGTKGAAARSGAADSLAKPNMRAAWAVLEGKVTREALTAASVTKERILTEIARLAYFDPATMYDEDGDLLPIRKMPVETRAALAGVETILKNTAAGDGVVDRVFKVRHYDKTRALEMAAKHLKLLTDVLEVTDTTDQIARLHRGRERAAKGEK